jgi:hypothetical protein
LLLLLLPPAAVRVNHHQMLTRHLPYSVGEVRRCRQLQLHYEAYESCRQLQLHYEAHDVLHLLWHRSYQCQRCGRATAADRCMQCQLCSQFTYMHVLQTQRIMHDVLSCHNIVPGKSTCLA